MMLSVQFRTFSYILSKPYLWSLEERTNTQFYVFSSMFWTPHNNYSTQAHRLKQHVLSAISHILQQTETHVHHSRNVAWLLGALLCLLFRSRLNKTKLDVNFQFCRCKLSIRRIKDDMLDTVSIEFHLNELRRTFMVEIRQRCIPSCISFHFIYIYFSAFELLSVLRSHSVFSSPPQRPMTSDFYPLHFFPNLIIQKRPVFPF